jgi:hypothetical protein
MEMTTLDTKLDKLSNKYKVVATKQLAEKFKSMGFVVDEYKETRVRKVSKQGYQKHLVRLSNPNVLSTKHNDIKLQLLVTNSHDGLSGFSIKLGFFRFVCANGLIVGDVFESVNLRHTGNIIEKVDDAVERMVAQTKKLDDAITAMKQKTLTEDEQREFISKAIKLRYPTKDIQDVSIPILRPEDGENNVFSLYNRVQETLIRGGNRIRGNNNRLRTARSLNAINAVSKVNEQLFGLANELSQVA